MRLIGLVFLLTALSATLAATPGLAEQPSPIPNSSELQPDLEWSDDDGLLPEEPPLVIVALQDELFIGTILITAWGMHFWEWFERPLHFQSEHGFSSRSSTGGADKLGHFLTSAVFSDLLSWRLSQAGFSPMRSALFGAVSAMALMTWIEVGDGTSAYGFSMEDLLADFLGVLFSFARQVIPHAEDLLDARVSYWPTSEYFESGEVVADYSGMKFLLALKLSGMGPLGRSPLRFVELHFGYYSRGFRTFDVNRDNASRHMYFGLGLNLKELLRPVLPEVIRKPTNAILSYYQLPWIAVEAKNRTL
jgi:hypothetical protein